MNKPRLSNAKLNSSFTTVNMAVDEIRNTIPIKGARQLSDF